MTGTRWVGGEPNVGARAVVVVPHPDDEVLGAGVLLRWLAARSVPTTLVAVTDGEASHSRSLRITPDELRLRRAEERRRALADLGVGALAIVHLGLPDGGVADHEDRLARRLAAMVDADTTLIAPWRFDSHPDHDACGRAAARARAGGGLWEVAIWAKVRDPDRAHHGARRLVGDAATTDAKRAAARRFATQIHPLGPDPEDGPVVRPDELRRMLDGPEVVRCG